MARKGERDPRRERFWREVVQRQRESGLTVKGFCRKAKLSEALYYFWRRELARRDRELPSGQRRRKRGAGATPRARIGRLPAASPPLFQELAIHDVASPADRGLEIILPGGCRVRVSAGVNRGLLADVLQALEARRC
jgi:transposase-like protein